MMKANLRSEYVGHQEGITSGVAYDTAWAARVKDQWKKPLFPECVQWLLENQKPDGSWGSQVLSYHDRILSTLSSIMALKEIDGKKYGKYIERGETYIWEAVRNLSLDNTRLIGSELLLPSLLEQAQSLDLNLPYHLKIYQREYYAKLNKIDESLWYSPLTTLSFSLEFLGDAADVDHLSVVQLPNGSVANSPAATAFFLGHIKDMKAFRYLREVLSLTGDGSLMTVYPVDVFELGWTMYNLLLAGLYFEKYTEICDFLFSHFGPSGIGSSTESPVADADDTAVVLKVLHDMGYPVDVRALDKYEKGIYYLTFNFELNPSVSTNIHVLDFVKSCSEFCEREEIIEQLVRFLKDRMHPEGFWIDKWYASPYYPTSHAVFALCEVEHSLAEKAVSWILNTQHENGMWGENGGTLEETAYAVQALMYYHQHAGCIDTHSISKAASALNREDFASMPISLADLWVGKVLYTPIRVVWSSIASAQFMARAGGLKMWNPVVCGR